MRVRVWRVLGISAVGLVVLLVAAVLLLHTNMVQSRVLAWSIGELERRFNLDLIADDLHYNLVRRRVTMTNVRLAAVGQRDRPFFAAQSVTVKLPWVVFRGRLQFDDIEVLEGRVLVHRNEAGVSNLPGGGRPRPPDAPPRRINARGLTVRNLEFTYADEQRDIEIRAPRVRTDLGYVIGKGASGPFAIGSDLIVRVGSRRVVVEPVTGNVVFDSSNLELENVRLKTLEGTISVNGTIERVLDRPNLDLTLSGTADIERSAIWAPAPVRVAGPARIEGTLKGPPSEFVMDTRVTSTDAVVGNARNVRIDALSRLTPTSLTVSKAIIQPSTGGEVTASAEIPWGRVPWWLTANYSELDAATAFRLAETEPLPFGAVIRGSARLDGRPGQPFRLRVNNTSAPRAAAGAAPLSGDLEFVVEGDRWRANQRQRLGLSDVSGRIGGQWNRKAVTQSTFEGQLDVRTADVGDAARSAALFGLTTPAVIRNSRGPMDATVTLSGRFTTPRFTGSARTNGVDIPSFGHAAFVANFDASERAVNITEINGTIGTAQVRGEYLANLVTRRLAGSLAIDAPSAGELLTALPENVRLEGPLTANATLSGTVDEPIITADIAGSGMSLANQPLESLVGKVRLVGDDLLVDSLTLTQGTGTLSVTGSYSLAKRTYTVDVQGQALQWQGALARFGNATAVFAVKFAGSGSLDRPAGEGTIDFDLSGGLAGDVIGGGTANVRLDGENALVVAKIPSLGASIDAKIATTRPFTYDALLVAEKVALPQVIRLAGLRDGYLEGTLSLNAAASGMLENVASSRVLVNLQEVDASAEGIPVSLAAPSRVTWDGTGLSIDTLDATVGTRGRLQATGRLAPNNSDAAKFDATFNGELGDLVRLGRPFGVPPELYATGPVTATISSTGGLDDATGTLQLVEGGFNWGELPTVTNLNVDATYTNATLNVTRLTGSWQGGGIEGTASIPRGVLQGNTGPAPAQPGFAKLRVVGLSEQAFAPWIPRPTLSSIGAHISATFDAAITRASIEGVSGRLTFDEANLLVAGVPVTQVRPSVFTIEDGIVSAQDVVWSFGGFAAATGPGSNPPAAALPGGGELSLTGDARLTPADKAMLDFSIRGDADLRILSAFAPTVAVDGTARVNVGLGGSPSSPVFSGRIDIAETEVLIREPRIVLADLNGTIAFDGRRVLFDSFSGTANGGELVVEGGFLLTGMRPTGGALTVQVQRAALEYPAGLQSESDALLTMRPGDDGWNLIGDVIVDRSVFNEPISIAALAAARQTRAPTPSDDDGRLQDLRLNVFVTTREDLRVDNNYARLEAGAAIRLVGPADEPVVGGRVTLREGGEVYLAGRTFHVARGSISFTNPNRIDPEFDVELQARASGADITLTLSGTMDRLQTEVRSSEPDIDSREAMAMLFGDLAGEDAVTLLSAELLGATGRAIGLDTLRVERGFDTDEFRADPGLIFTETDPSTRLTLSKRLRPDVEVTLSQSLRESGGLSAVVSYKPRRNIELRFISRDNLDRAVALRHEITLGGRAQDTVTRPPQPEVSAITFTGDLRRPEQELIEKMSLDIGEEFDFYRWQRDLDDIRAEYQELGFYEIRVRGTRQVSEDGRSVALNYNVIPGPVAELVIVGHQLERELEEEIRDSWRRTIFDRFLIEDVQARIRRHLIAEDIVGSTVRAEVSLSTSERKELRVTVETGVEVQSRDITFSGNHAFRADDLNRVIRDAGAEVDGWLEPARVEDALERHYRNNGFLEVSVRADRPEVVSRRARLPVTITEGRRFALEAIEFPGAHADRVIDVARAADLELGMPYNTAALEAARRRVQDYYARLGFNTASVELEPVPDTAEGVVDLTFAIKEGPQQIVREVTTDGAVETREGVITAALNIDPGEPVNLAQWSLARKRLYDTNVFRQVDIEAIPIEATPEEQAAGVQPVRAVVRVIEYPVWRLRYGLQLNDEKTSLETDPVEERQQNLGILSDIRNQNLFGRAITAGVAGRLERDRRSESVFLSNSSFFGLPIRTSGFIFDARQRFRIDGEVEAISDRRGVSFEQRWRPSRRAEVTYGYRFERNHTWDPTPTGFFPFDEVVNVAKLTVAAYMDRRDDPFQPSRGWFSSANMDQAIEALGSDFRTSKLLLQQLYFRSVGRLVLAGRAQIGVEFSDANLLPSERFLLGGATTVRGYAENALGPYNPAIGVVGGDGLLLFNAEARFPVRGWVQGVTFVDAGNVFEGKRTTSLGDLKVGYGVGLRLASPFAMLRADFGIPASSLRSGEPKSKGRFYIGIGHIF